MLHSLGAGLEIRRGYPDTALPLRLFCPGSAPILPRLCADSALALPRLCADSAPLLLGAANLRKLERSGGVNGRQREAAGGRALCAQ
ncbi:hypothetical protein chiPu_0004617 [Chiloscyllium punctatum]|uniref:Uncharacterized protein n=1 Tax=Chiloscyllium punctatum TaxID=137246 RepID=A0A401S730_CHIPU|nr:hypothetical protein [Chiloscyllium punctatum]